MGSQAIPHFVIFPFMSQGHIIPLLHLSRLLHRRSTVVTVVTTAGNAPSVRAALGGTDISTLELSFPQTIDGVPLGVENTLHLPSMDSLLPFLQSTMLMQRDFEKSLAALSPPVSCVISDGFLGWTLESADKFHVPRFVFFGMGSFSSTIYQVLGREKPHANASSLDEPFAVPGFPGLELTRNDFSPPFSDVDPSGPYADFMVEMLVSMAMSRGVIVNSFYEFEREYVDYWNEKIGPKAHCVGPLCISAEKQSLRVEKAASYAEFLDLKLSSNEPVLYVSFGTQADVSKEQIMEVAKGLERSGVSFLWALRVNDVEFLMGFEERVKGRGVLVKEWVDQLEILRHGGVGGFLSHCGWNSVMESLSTSVPLIALPFMAEQHLNARFVSEVARVGLRAAPEGGSVRGFVTAEEMERRVRELMGGGGRGAEVRRKVAEYGVVANASMRDGGSSTRSLDLLVEEIAGGIKVKV